jgi:membrane protease YdiL (CAAX protease family)
MDFSAFRDMKPFAQLMFALFVMVASVFLFMVAGMLLALPFYGAENLMTAMSESKLNSPEGINFLKYLQVIQSVGLFVAPPFVISRLYDGNISEYLKMNRSTQVQSYLLASLCLLAVIPSINFLGDINSKMSLPESFSGLESWMKNMEEGAKVMIEKFMLVDGFSGLMFNIFMIAVLPALGEELMFRGVFQRIFSNWTRSHHWGIWITAFLFSAMHMQFYGFLPRLLLGAMFGYLLVWTGTMWVPIVAHFVNNLMGVLGYFLIGKGVITNDVEEWGTVPEQIPWVICSVLAVSGLLYLVYRTERTKRKMPANQTDSQA